MRLALLTPNAGTMKLRRDPSFLEGILAMVDVKVAPSAVADWTYLERCLAYDWAMREHIRASDRIIQRRDKPSFVVAAEVGGCGMRSHAKDCVCAGAAGDR